MKVGSVADVKARIAEAIIGNRSSDGLLGTVHLHDHQSEGVVRIIQSMQKFRGALL